MEEGRNSKEKSKNISRNKSKRSGKRVYKTAAVQIRLRVSAEVQKLLSAFNSIEKVFK